MAVGIATVSLKRYKFTGMERDEETGLQRHGVRYYATWLGRWTSADPIGLGDGGNRYCYCHALPNEMRDLSGLEAPNETESWTTDSAGQQIPWDPPSSLRSDALTGYYPNEVSKKIIRHYLFGGGADVHIGTSELREANLSLTAPAALFALATKFLAAHPEGGIITSDFAAANDKRHADSVAADPASKTIELRVKKLGRSEEPGGMGPFAGVLRGQVSVDASGRVLFEGFVQVDEQVDYHVTGQQEDSSGRTQAPRDLFFTDGNLIAAKPLLLGGKEYRIRSDEIPVKFSGTSPANSTWTDDGTFSDAGGFGTPQGRGGLAEALPLPVLGALIGGVGGLVVTKRWQGAAAGALVGAVALPLAGGVLAEHMWR